MKYFFIYLAVVNVIGFLLMRYDKSQAKSKRRRVSERRIFTYAAVGGAAGIWAGMYKYRHKTKHMSFVLGIPVIAVMNAAVVFWVVTRWL